MPIRSRPARLVLPSRQRGVALLLMLLVVGVGAAFMALSALNKNNAHSANNQATMTSLTQARDALIGFAVANNRLPRPAISATNGLEMAACATDAACTGFIPWTTLGVPKLDNWGKIIRYSVTPAFTNAPLASTTPPTKTVQTRNSGVLVFEAGKAGCTPFTVPFCTPAVIFSHGANNFGNTDIGNSIPNGSTGTNIDEIANNGATVNFIRRMQETSTTALGGEFDDLLVWIDYGNLKTLMDNASVW